METDEKTLKPIKYNVALSFAGEDREFVERAAGAMRSKGIRIFYDRHEEVELWGKNLYPSCGRPTRETNLLHMVFQCIRDLSTSSAERIRNNRTLL